MACVASQVSVASGVAAEASVASRAQVALSPYGMVAILLFRTNVSLGDMKGIKNTGGRAQAL